MRVSSAYCKTSHGRPSSVGCWTPLQFLIKHYRVSATSRNRYGDIGSPCRKPLMHVIHGPGHPLTRTADFVEVRMVFIQLIHRSLKPRACKTLNKPSQFTVSKAFAKSNLSTTAGFFLLWHTCTNSAAWTNVSEIDRPLIKPVCLMSMRLGISFCNLEVRILERILRLQF